MSEEESSALGAFADTLGDFGEFGEEGGAEGGAQDEAGLEVLGSEFFCALEDFAEGFGGLRVGEGDLAFEFLEEKSVVFTGVAVEVVVGGEGAMEGDTQDGVAETGGVSDEQGLGFGHGRELRVDNLPGSWTVFWKTSPPCPLSTDAERGDYWEINRGFRSRGIRGRVRRCRCSWVG